MRNTLICLTIIIMSIATANSTEPVATFSIVGCDPVAGELGVAVASKYFAVGSVVPWAKAGIGAVATQSYLNYDFGIVGLELMEDGMSPQDVIDSLVASDPEHARRQIGVVDFDGDAATYTGSECLDWAGGAIGKNCAAQGNILASDSVVTNMIRAFENTEGDLASRLMAALLAGDSAGGDARGKQSAALYVVSKKEGIRFDRKIDVRVDDSPEPFVELQRLFRIAEALSHLDDAAYYNRIGEIQLAVKEARMAVQIGPKLPETYYDLACYLSLAGQFDEALVSIESAIKLAPDFKSMARNDSDLTGLRNFPEFQDLIR